MDIEGCEDLEAQILHDKPTVIFVSHDRRFTENIATRHLLIHDGGMIEIANLADWYAMVEADAALGEPGPAPEASDTLVLPEEEEAQLERLLALEEKLAADLARKPKHQKPARQASWRAEIDALYAQLEGKI